jgi:hypothetical protein
MPPTNFDAGALAWNGSTQVVKVQDEETMRGIMSLYASCIHQAQATAQAPYQDEPLDGAAVGDEQVQAHGIIDGTQTAHQ